MTTPRRKRPTKRVVDEVRAALDARDGVGADGDFAAYRGRPGDFAREVLGLSLWSHQLRALEALEQHRRVAWRTGHGVGKSTVSVVAAMYWCACYPGALAVLTAPSYRQVSLVLWRTLQRMHRGALRPLGGTVFDVPERGWRLPGGGTVVGFAAGSPEQLAGLHAQRVLIVVDEASGVEATLFEALKGSLTGASRLLLIGNPTRQSGEFFDAFGRKGDLYHPLHTSALDSPNISGAEPAIPGLVDREWLLEAQLDFGPESAAFQVRALGEFATQAADCVISIDLVEGAKERWLVLRADVGPMLGRLEVGVDVARFGDDESVIVCRRGPFMYEPIAFRGADAVAVADRVVQAVADKALAHERALVRVDATGVGGGVADLLRATREGIMEVVDVQAGATPKSPRFMRVRDELLFGLRDWLRNGGALPPDPKLEGELLAPTYGFSPSQKVQIESKDETKKKIKRSPDRMDAAALSVYSVIGEPAFAETFNWRRMMRGDYTSGARAATEPTLPHLIARPVRETPLGTKYRVVKGGIFPDLSGGWTPIATNAEIEIGVDGWNLDRLARLRQALDVEELPDGGKAA
jgi:hypothetical protein